MKKEEIEILQSTNQDNHIDEKKQLKKENQIKQVKTSNEYWLIILLTIIVLIILIIMIIRTKTDTIFNFY